MPQNEEPTNLVTVTKGVGKGRI